MMSTICGPCFEPVWSSALLRMFTSTPCRPNLLVVCPSASSSRILREVARSCAAPLHYRRLPGVLDLPRRGDGTLVLDEVGGLDLSQQIALYDWMTSSNGDHQIVSLTTGPLEPLVENGSFLEGLYYRLNVVRLNAR
jgi:hypothetical protein